MQVTLRSCEMEMVPYWYGTRLMNSYTALYFTLSLLYDRLKWANNIALYLLILALYRTKK